MCIMTSFLLMQCSPWRLVLFLAHNTAGEAVQCVLDCNMHLNNVINSNVRNLQNHAHSPGFLEAPVGLGSMLLELLLRTQPETGTEYSHPPYS